MNSGRLTKQQKGRLKRKGNKNCVHLTQTLKRISLKFVLLRKHKYEYAAVFLPRDPFLTEYSAHSVHLKSQVVFRTSLTGHGSYQCDEFLFSIISSFINIFLESEILFFQRTRSKMFMKFFFEDFSFGSATC
jgi:hypothetical protein